LRVFPRDKEIIENTLNRILDPTSNYTITWVDYGVRGKYGAGGHDRITLNSSYLSADNGPADFSNDDVRHLIAHTIAHEVNHIVNYDHRAESYEYFLEEYRAYYVGFMAEHGRAPTRHEMAKRVLVFVQDNKSYEDIWSALQSEGEGDKILAFISQFLGRDDVTRNNVAELVLDAYNDKNDSTPAIPPVFPDDYIYVDHNDMDN
jgi:hypothetical protein